MSRNNTAETLDQNETPEMESVGDQYVNSELQDLAAANDSIRLEAANDDSYEMEVSEGESAGETSMGKGGGSSTASGAQAAIASAIGIEIPSVLQDQNEVFGEAEKEQAERDLAHFRSMMDRKSLSGKVLNWAGGKDFSAMSDNEKILYLTMIRTQSHKDIWAQEDKGFFGKIKDSVVLWSVRRFESTKIGKEIFETAEKAQLLAEKTEDIKEDVTEGVDKAQKVGHDIREGMDSARENPAVVQLMNDYNRQMRDAWSQSPGKSPQKVAASIKNITSETLRKGSAYKADFYSAVEKGKFQGMNFRTTGKFMFVEVLSRGIMDGFREGGSFTDGLTKAKETLADSNTWKEAVPGVGSWKSLQRLFSDNGDPMHLKALDAGLNVVGDGILLAGVIGGFVSFGATAAAGVAARGGILATGKSFLKKQALKQGAKNLTSKTALKTGATQAARLTGKTTWSLSKWTAATMAVEKSLETFFPTDKIMDFAVEQGTSHLLTERQAFIGQDLGLIPAA